jgi:hypothetical protein
MRSGRTRFAGFVLVALASATVPAARAACPQVPCDCLGQAAQYDLVASQSVDIRFGSYFSDVTLVHAGSSVNAVCTTTGSLTGTLAFPGSGSTGVGTFVAIAGPGSQAARASTRGGSGTAVSVGLLVTGGGTFDDADEADVQQLDTSGTHAQVSTCTQAMADVQSGSQTLAALAPTSDYGEIVLTPGEELDINAGPGVTVIKAAKVVLRSRLAVGFATLRINTVPETEAVIINTERLSVGSYSNIEGGGGKTFINVIGPGTAVRYGRFARVDVPVLAPERVLRMAGAFFFSMKGTYARSVFVRAANLFGDCP